MARMMRSNTKAGLCSCCDCYMGSWFGRAQEKRDWQRELEREARADEIGQALDDFADESDWQFLIGA